MEKYSEDIDEIKLTTKHEKFVHEYMKGFSLSATVDKLGDTLGITMSGAKKMLARDDVQRYIALLRREANKDSVHSLQDLIEHASKVAFADVSGFYDKTWFNVKDLKDLPPDLSQMIAGTKTKRIAVRNRDGSLYINPETFETEYEETIELRFRDRDKAMLILKEFLDADARNVELALKTTELDNRKLVHKLKLEELKQMKVKTELAEKELKRINSGKDDTGNDHCAIMVNGQLIEI